MLKDYIPEVEYDVSLFDFAGKIVKNINNSDEPEIYGKSIMLMSKFTLEDLQELSTTAILKEFIEGLKTNNIIGLKSFCESIGI